MFHAMAPSGDLITHLTALSHAHILVALVLDSDTSFGPDIQSIVESPDWRGPVLRVPPAGTGAPAPMGASVGAAQRVTLLPEVEGQRMAVLRRLLVDTRGDALRSSTGTQPGSDRLPVLKGVGGDRP